MSTPFPFIRHRRICPNSYHGVPSLDDATPVVVVGGADTSGIDASLEVGGSISGTLTGAGVGPLEGILVEACTVDLPIVCGYGGTVAGGTWSIEALGVGDYTVLFRPSSGFVPEFFDDVVDCGLSNARVGCVGLQTPGRSTLNWPLNQLPVRCGRILMVMGWRIVGCFVRSSVAGSWMVRRRGSWGCLVMCRCRGITRVMG